MMKPVCYSKTSTQRSFREQWKLSIIPLDWGWKLIVVEVETYSVEHALAQTEEVNCAPLSEARRAGIPKSETQVKIKACAYDSTEIEANGAASTMWEV